MPISPRIVGRAAGRWTASTRLAAREAVSTARRKRTVLKGTGGIRLRKLIIVLLFSRAVDLRLSNVFAGRMLSALGLLS